MVKSSSHDKSSHILEKMVIGKVELCSHDWAG